MDTYLRLVHALLPKLSLADEARLCDGPLGAHTGARPAARGACLR